MSKPIELYRKARFKYLPKVLKRCLRIEPRDDMQYLGSQYGGWSVPAQLIGPKSIVYCVGCGEDITFDLGLIDRFGCDVWAFDPTPRAIAHVEQQLTAEPRYRDKYHFRPVGVWSEDKRTTFFMNDNPIFVSGSLVGLTGTKQAIDVEVRQLSTLMEENGHERIDFLKLDVEGAEYEVLENMLAGPVRPLWLGIDFDQPTPFRKTHSMIEKLRRHGYRLAEIRVWDYVFVRDVSIAGADTGT